MKIAILTNFQDMNPGYSLTGIVADQYRMLVRHGHDVYVFTSQHYNEAYDGIDFSIGNVKHVIPFGHLIDYDSETKFTEGHIRYSQSIANVLREQLTELQIDFAFTHDWVFTGWNLPFAVAVLKVSRDLPDVKWMHWIHSQPTGSRDWWAVKRYGPMHKLIFPNETDRLRVAEQFRGEIEDVRVIPHIKDLRTYYDFSKDTWEIIDRFPGLLHSSIVQVYPASTDRLGAKGIHFLLQIFAAIKEFGLSVCFLVANQWATGRQRKEEVSEYLEAAKLLHFDPDEFGFTSEIKKEYEAGISRRVLREIQLCSNLFIYPTREESFGLVGPEAALSGAYMVLNRSLTMMYEIFGSSGLYFDFGSFHSPLSKSPSPKYWNDVASIVLGRMWNNETIRTRTFCRQTYNMDAVYENHYAKVFAESELWDQRDIKGFEYIPELDEEEVEQRDDGREIVVEEGGNDG
jgi:glycosyltransferase involved in cell wall biosynthesis